jgi:RNA-binding protein Musashi
MLYYQEDDFRPIARTAPGGYGAYNAYISAATRYAALGAPTLYDHPGPFYGSKHQWKLVIFAN